MKKIFFSFVIFMILSSVAFAEGKTSILIDGLNIKDLKSAEFTLVFREVKDENQGSVDIKGKIIFEDTSQLFGRIYDSDSVFNMTVFNTPSYKDAETQTLRFKNCKIKSVSKGIKKVVYHFEAEKIE